MFAVFAVGFIGQKVFRLDLKAISTTAMYLVMPFLTFTVFLDADLTRDTWWLVVYAVILAVALLFFVYVISFFRGYSMSERCALVLSTVFMNGGNYGVPVALFAFGVSGLHPAVILMVIQSLIMSTVGLYFAAKGGSTGQAISPLKQVLKMPMTHGALLGLLFNIFHISLPTAILRPVTLISDAAIPLVMVLLGMQLANISLRKIPVEKVTMALVGRLLLSPLIALVIAFVLPVSDVVGKVMILIAAMPSAANTTMFALQFNTQPNVVTSSTFISTLISIVTIPILLALLMS